MGHRGLPKVIQVRKIYMQKSDFLSFALHNCPVPTPVILMAEKSESFGVGDVGLGSVPENVKCGEKKTSNVGSTEDSHWLLMGQNIKKDDMGLVVLGWKHQGPDGPFIVLFSFFPFSFLF